MPQLSCSSAQGLGRSHPSLIPGSHRQVLLPGCTKMQVLGPQATQQVAQHGASIRASGERKTCPRPVPALYPLNEAITLGFFSLGKG